MQLDAGDAPCVIIQDPEASSFILFNTYMKILQDSLHNFVIKCHQYDNDTQIYITTLSQQSQNLKLCSGGYEELNGVKQAPAKSYQNRIVDD